VREYASLRWFDKRPTTNEVGARGLGLGPCTSYDTGTFVVARQQPEAVTDSARGVLSPPLSVSHESVLAAGEG